jgi:hypothetical protein
LQSVVAQASKPAGRTHAGRATHFHALPIWKSPIQQVWKPALRLMPTIFGRHRRIARKSRLVPVHATNHQANSFVTAFAFTNSRG